MLERSHDEGSADPWAEVVHVQDISTGFSWVLRRRYDGPELRGLALELSAIVLSHGKLPNVIVETKSVRVRDVVCVVYYSIPRRIRTFKAINKSTHRIAHKATT